MQLIDSNILIYSAKPEYTQLRKLIVATNYISLISKIEVLGFHQLIEKDKIYFNACFSTLLNLHVDENIIEKAIELRRENKLSLGDSLIAATSLCFNLELVTRNLKDFEGIKGLKIINPIK